MGVHPHFGLNRFTRLMRLGNSNTEMHGLGLGLWCVRRVGIGLTVLNIGGYTSLSIEYKGVFRDRFSCAYLPTSGPEECGGRRGERKDKSICNLSTMMMKHEDDNDNHNDNDDDEVPRRRWP